MFSVLKRNRVAWLAAGLVIGLAASLMIGGLWPHTPLHAVGGDRTSTFAMATGPIDDEVEAVFFLDFLTGNLSAVVLGKQGNRFTNFYLYNVLRDLDVDPSKNPQYMMTTGMIAVRRGAARMQPSMAAVYVAEVTGGRVAAYGIPWSKSAYATGQVVPPQPLIPLAVTRFRKVEAPAGGAGAAPGT